MAIPGKGLAQGWSFTCRKIKAIRPVASGGTQGPDRRICARGCALPLLQKPVPAGLHCRFLDRLSRVQNSDRSEGCGGGNRTGASELV